MAKQTYTVIEGFLFTDQQSVARARKEAESIKFLKEKMNRGNPTQVLELYQKMIDQKMFQTPVGYGFLLEIQEYLKTKPTIRLDQIPAIPVMEPLKNSSLIKDAFENRARSVEQAAREELAKRDEKNGVVDGVAKEVEDAPKGNKKEKKQKGMGVLALSFFLNIVLAIIVVGMFAISYTRHSTTILNYESDLIKKYEYWESELSEREAAIKEKEAELKINN